MFDDFEQFLEKLAPGLGSRQKPGILYRKGGDASDWAEPGNKVYVPVVEFFQLGAIEWSGTAATQGLATYAFPRAYYGEPLLFVQVMACSPVASITTRAASGGDAIEIFWRSDIPVTSIHFAWLAYGGQLQKSA